MNGCERRRMEVYRGKIRYSQHDLHHESRGKRQVPLQALEDQLRPVGLYLGFGEKGGTSSGVRFHWCW